MKTPLFILLALSTLAVSCNEKISPELQNANSSTVIPPVVQPSEYYFRVVDSSPAIQGYRLHRTGAGNASRACEVKKTGVALSNAWYSGGDPDSDISCYFEAEELALFHGGFNIKIEASPNTCEYVGYAPFSFYNRMPGSSSSSLVQVSCMNETTNSSHVASITGHPTYGAGGNPVECGAFADEAFNPSVRGIFTVEDDNDLCRFNYKDGDKEQCDEGIINIRELQVTYTPPEGATPSTLKSEWKSRRVFCKGKAHNCVQGPIRAMTKKSIRMTEMHQTEKNNEFSKEYKYPGRSGDVHNLMYANYRRELASPTVDFISRSNPGYALSFLGNTNFQANVMEFYAANQFLNATPLITGGMWDAASVVYSGAAPIYTARPYAAEPFLGIGGYRTQPFYTFFCFDSAFDIKARIRMVVRDWDRTFAGNTTRMELVSDIFEDQLARQDNPGYLEIPYDPGMWNDFNDAPDWDDILLMTRTPGAYSASSTMWEPDAGYFSPSLFPTLETDGGD